MVEKIDYARSLDIEDALYIDTRAPVEFEKDHVPGAVNIPIFDNEERALIGTMYKQVSQELAIEKGMEIYGRKIESIKNKLLEFNERTPVIYCWRGGMRSKTITGLAQSMGLGCFQLSGGYKSYRKHVREQLESFSLKPGLVVLHGLTGSGKTELLKQFKDSLDLEGLARHRSSVYGAVGLFPHTQKMFESLLLQELQRLSKRKNILIEGESRKIGNIIMPGFLFSAMKRGVNVRVGCTLRSRVKRLASIYADSPRDVANVREITKGLESRLGKKTVSELLGFLDKGETGMFMQVLLEKYYDPLYMHSIGDLAYDISIDSDDIRAAARILRERYGLD